MTLCHTSCDIINVGTLEDYLIEVNTWMRRNPYDVVTFVIGNYDHVAPTYFADVVEKAGMMNMVYTPPKAPMGLNDWPTLSEMILKQRRAVFFMDYEADQSSVPWLMDEFSSMWETPFSPTDPAFPCSQQRPPGLSPEEAKNRMYMANHNLNLELNLGPINLLIPNYADLGKINAVNGNGSLGRMASDCACKFHFHPWPFDCFPRSILTYRSLQMTGDVHQTSSWLTSTTLASGTTPSTTDPCSKWPPR